MTCTHRKIIRLDAGLAMGARYIKMVRQTASILALVFLACVSTPGVPQQLVAPVLNDADLSAVERLGYRIYLKDVAAQRATDAALGRTDIEHGRVAGWITLLSGTQARVLFVDREGRAMLSAELDVATSDIPLVRRNDPPVRLRPTEERMWKARTAAAATRYRACTDRYNMVVLEAPESDAWYVYLLAATSELGVVMLGGHHRVQVSSDGDTVIEELPLTKSCIEHKPKPPAGASVAGMFVSHIITDEPMESHVYLSLLHGLPLYVVTQPGMWAVERGRIRQVQE